MRRARFLFPILAVLLFASGKALCADHMTSTPVGSTLWIDMQDVAVQGNYAYCSKDKGIVVVDISNISEPLFVRQIGIDSGLALGSMIVGNYLYVALWTNGLGIYDLSDPGNPSMIGHYNPGVYINDVFVSGNYAYLTDQNGLFMVVDISTPSFPHLSATLFGATSSAFSVKIVDTVAYVGTNIGVTSINVANPDTCMVISTCSIFGRVLDIAISNGIAYAACDYGGLQVIAIPSPDNMSIIGSHSSHPYARGVYIVDSLLYLVNDDFPDTDSGLVIFNVSNPANPIPIGLYNNPDGRRLLVRDSLAFVADFNVGLLLLNIANPAAPTLTGKFGTYSSQSSAVVGNRAYVAGGALSVVDITDKTDPIIEGQLPLSYTGVDIVVRDTFAFVTGYPWNPYLNVGQFDIFSIADDYNPYLINTVPLPRAGYCLAVQGNYAYVGGYDSLRIFDISNPQIPLQVGSYYLPFCEYIAVRGDYAYVPNLKIINISNPASPYLEGETTLHATPGGIALSGNYAYIVLWTGELMMGWINSVDITNPAAPSLLDHEVTDDDAFSIALKDNYAVVGTYSGLHFFNIADPNSLVASGLDRSWGRIIDISIDGDYCYLPNGSAFQIALLGVTCCDLPGDYDNNGRVNALDITRQINRLFKNGIAPGCPEEADADGNGAFNVLDVTHLINFLYKHGPTPICPL